MTTRIPIALPFDCSRAARPVTLNGYRVELYDGPVRKAVEDVYTDCSGQPACGVRFKTSTCPYSASR